MIVMKFGGTSNQDATAMLRVVDIISRHRSQKPIVVISAVAQATNILERAGTLAAQGKDAEARDALHALFERHYGILDKIVTDQSRRAELRSTFAASLKELEELVKGVAILRELTPRTIDSICAYGELSSSRLVAAALQENDVQAAWIDTKDFMITDDVHTRALPIMDVVQTRLAERVRPLIEQNVVPVTQGFIGVTSSGHRTTMGRESSDFSASIIGAALGAAEIQIWTDVDGVLTADPRVVRTPKKIKVLSFEEAFELSYFGAKVLHPHTMLPAMERNIPICILSSRHPDSSGTKVTHILPSRDEPVVKSIAYKNTLTLLELSPRKRFSQYIFWEHVFNVLTQYGVSARVAGTSEYNMTLVVDGTEIVDGLLSDLGAVGTVDVRPGKGILSVVGRNIRESPDLLARIFGAVRGSPIAFVSHGASKSSVTFVVDDAIVPELVRRLHDEFFSGHPDSEFFEEREDTSVQVTADVIGKSTVV